MGRLACRKDQDPALVDRFDIGGDTISVLILADDPITRAGVEHQLLTMSDFTVLVPTPGCHPDIALIVADTVDDKVLGWIRTIGRHSPSRIVLVAAVSGHGLTAASEAGAHGILHRSLADQRRLAWAIQKVHGGESVAVRDATEQPERAAPIQPRRTSEAGSNLVSARDREVLRLLADGCDTAEIARALAYSEQTVKNVIQRLFEQLKAKNRPHAVALAVQRASSDPPLSGTHTPPGLSGPDEVLVVDVSAGFVGDGEPAAQCPHVAGQGDRRIFQ